MPQAGSQPREEQGVRQLWCAYFFVLCLAGCWPGTAAQASELVVVDDGSPPIMDADSAGQARGVYPAIVAAAFARMKVPLEIKPWPFKRVVAELTLGHAGVGGLIYTAERGKLADYSRPYITEVIRSYARAGDVRPGKPVPSLKHLTIGVRRGWSYGVDFDAARAQGDIKVAEFGLDRQGFEMLMAGRIDRMLSTEWTAAVMARDARLAGIQATDDLVLTFDIHLAFSKRMDKAALLKAFDATVAEMRRSGEIERIVQQEIARAPGAQLN